MSTRGSSAFLQPPPPGGVMGAGAAGIGQTQGTQQFDQSATAIVRPHSVVLRPPHASTASTSNVFRSLSTIHRSTSALPASLLDLDVVSTAGLQVIRPDTHPEAFVPVPPDGGWGWVVVLAAFITNLIIDGICVSFGIMVTDLVEHFNASVATVMLIGSLLLGVYQIVGPAAAGLVNRFGCRAVGIGGSLLATASIFASAFMPTIELMLVTYGVIAGAAFGFLHLPSIICVSFYFDSRRALAIGVTSCGTPLGAMIFAPLTEMLLQHYGWSNTLVLFAGMLLNCTVLAALYRPLTPALLLTPMKASEAEAIKSLLQLAAREEEAAAAATSGDRLGSSGTTPPITSQRDLRDQPVPEEDEEEDEKDGEEEKEGETRKEANVQRRLRRQQQRQRQQEQGDQPQLEVTEVGQEKLPHPQLGTIAERPEGEVETEEEGGEEEKEKGEERPRHHRHYRRRRSRKTFRQRLQQQYEVWLRRIHLLRQSRSWKEGKEEEEQQGENDDDGTDLGGGVGVSRMRGESDALSSYSDVSTCGSSCDEGGSHWDSTSDADETVTLSRSGDNEPIPPRRPSRKLNEGDIRMEAGSQGRKSSASRRSASTVECILSAPSLTQPGKSSTGRIGGLGRKQSHGIQRRSHLSECRPSRRYTRPIPRQSVVHLANVTMSRRRSESVAVGALTRSHMSSLGSTLYASTAAAFGGTMGGLGAGGGAVASVEELADATPVIVELPHESITVEDYARPLYRKDIFFPGSVKRQIASSTASIAGAVANMMDAPGDQMVGSQLSVGLADGVHRRKITAGTPQFGSSIVFGDNVPLPPINEASVPESGVPEDANWTGSCLVSLTKIPLPDVFETEEEEAKAEDGTKLWDLVKSQTGLNLADATADGIYRVPRSHTLCGWWLCWETQRNPIEDPDADEMERFRRALVEDGGLIHHPMKLPQRVRLVLIRRCVFLPKSMFDVLTTMMNLSLLKEKSFSIYCLASLIAVMGIYVPIFFVCDLADSFSIPKSQSAYLLTVYGGASVVSRLSASWLAGKPNVSSTMLTAVTLLMAGVSVCIMPYWGSLIGLILLMVIFGLTVSPFFALTSITLCDILDLEALTNAYGIVTMVRGIASTAGSPLAGMIMAATSTFSVALLAGGATVIIGGLIYVVIIFLERAKLAKMMKSVAVVEQGKV